jgi:hypothetical protein
MTLSPAERVGAYGVVRPVARRATADRAGARTRARALVAASAALLFLMSLYPRAINLGGYLTTDEGNWMGRTALFTQALVVGDPVGTYQSGHPGVMTMWASLIGMGPDRALALVEHVRPDGLEKAPGYLETLRLARRSFAVLTSLAVVGIALLTWRLFGAGPGLVVGVLLGLEPFFLAHSVVAHVDSNVTTWMSVCLLASLVYYWGGGSRAYLAASGLAAGLAFLSKAPSAFLPIFIPLVALSSLVLPVNRTLGPEAPTPARLPQIWGRGREHVRFAGSGPLRKLVADGLIWGLLAVAVPLLLWPSFRADPIGTLQQMVGYTEAVGGSDHENFFLGQPVGDPGVLYYLVALGFRLTPATMVGLALLAIGIVPIGRRLPAGWLPRIALLAAFCVLFVGMMAMAPKKFDRYLLPIFPTLEVLAAVGIWLALRRLPGQLGGRLLPAALLAIGVAQIVPVAIVYPYYLAYYNPLLGGGPAASRSIVVGWGEGLDLVMAHLNAKPNAERLTVAGFYPRVMSAQFEGSILSDKQYDAAMADYIVLYVNAVQRDLANRLRTVTRGKRSELTVRINGIEYAKLYPVPPPPRRDPAGTVFGGAIRLERSFLKSDERPYLKSNELNPGDTIELTLRWTVSRPTDEDLTAVVDLVDLRGALIARHEEPVGGAESRTSAMRPNESGIEAHRIALPAGQREYEVLVGLKRPNGEWLPITSWPERLAQEARRPPGQVVVDSIDVQ